MTTTDRPAVAARKKRHPFRWILVAAALLIALIVIIAVASSGGEKNSSPGSAATIDQAPVSKGDPLTDDSWTVSDIQVVDNQFGDMVTASVTNNTDSQRSDLFQLTAYFGGKRLGIYTGATNNVAGHQTVSVTFLGQSQIQIPDTGVTYVLQSGL